MIDWYDLSLYKLSSDTYLGWWRKAGACQALQSSVSNYLHVKLSGISFQQAISRRVNKILSNKLFPEDWTKFLCKKFTEAKSFHLTTNSASQAKRFSPKNSEQCFQQNNDVFWDVIRDQYMCRRAVSGIPSDSNRVDCGATLVARKSYYDEEYSVYLCGRASLLSLMAVRRFMSYSV